MNANALVQVIMQPPGARQAAQAPSHHASPRRKAAWHGAPQARSLAGGLRQVANGSRSSPGRLASANESHPTSSPGGYSIQLIQPERSNLDESLHDDGLAMRPDKIDSL